MSTCLIGLGSNLGDREGMLLDALKRLGEHPQIDAIRHSGWLETAPIGGPPEQGPYLNAAARVETSLDPEAMLGALAGIETSLGRQRGQRWGARTIDLDLLIYDRIVRRTPQLTIPHPRMAWRQFVLRPAVEVAPSMLHPTTGWTLSRLLEHLDSALPYVAITGAAATGKSHLAQRLVRGNQAQLISDYRQPGQVGAFGAPGDGNAWAVQLEFLQGRIRRLGRDLPGRNAPNSTWVSDFWLAQSLAYAEVWLSPRQFDLFCPIWEDAQSRVIQPKLTVLLDLGTNPLLHRSSQPACPERNGDLSERQEEIRHSLRRLADRPDHGPTMWLADTDEDRMFAEVRAAVEAIKA